MSDARDMRPGEDALFAAWEAAERPYPWTAAQFSSAAAGRPARVRVWEEDGRPVAYAAFQVVGDEAYLQNFMTDPSRRRRGHGETLLGKVMIEARENGARRLLLDVDAANGPALALYAKAGFRALERRRRAYPRGEDALVMAKDL